MPDSTQLLMFIVAGWLLNLTPGPDVLYIVSSALKSGVRAGMVAALGIVSGCFVHVFAAALGVGALLATSATAFTVLKWVGAAYLMWMGVKLLRAKGGSSVVPAAASHEPADLGRIFRQGFLTNVLNPKVALFFLAFVPQFIAHDAPNKALAFIVLGCIFNFNAMLWCHFLAVSAALASRRVQASRRVALWLNRAIGAMFLGFGLRLALSPR